MKLRVGIIGFGVGEQHIRGFENAGVNVVAICDRDPEKREDAKKNIQTARFLKTQNLS